MSNGLYQPRKRRVEMNLLPLIDVLVMLIFFAFVTMQFRSIAALNLTLPKVETAGTNDFQSPIVIGFDKEGALSFNGKPATEAELAELVKQVAAATKDVTVLIRADEKTQLDKVTHAMDICRKNGLNKIRLQSR